MIEAEANLADAIRQRDRTRKLGQNGTSSQSQVEQTQAQVEVAEARLPSAMFCRPDRAACTIWSTVRDRGSRNFSQNQTVAS